MATAPTAHPHNFPKIHNAGWPGVVGKGGDAEPPISLDDMLRYTSEAEVDGVRFDGIDLFLFDPHVSIDSTDDDLKALADQVRGHGLMVGSVVAPVWPPTGGGPAIDAGEGRRKFLEQVRKGCRIAAKLRELGVRPHGLVRIDSATGVGDWAADPEGNQGRIAATWKEAAVIARDHGERLAAEGEICWGGMHSWRRMVELLELVGEPETVGFQADMAHTLLFTLGENAPEDRILPPGYDWKEPATLDAALRTLTAACLPASVSSMAVAAPPRIEKQGDAFRLVVQGKPMLMLAGELGNSSASSEAYMAPHWARLRAMHLNTVLAPVSWELIEPREGQFGRHADPTRAGQRPPSRLPVVRRVEEQHVDLCAGLGKARSGAVSAGGLAQRPERRDPVRLLARHSRRRLEGLCRAGRAHQGGGRRAQHRPDGAGRE